MSESNSSAHRRCRSERDQLDLFRALPGHLAQRGAQELMPNRSSRWQNLSELYPSTAAPGQSRFGSKPCRNKAWRPSGTRASLSGPRRKIVEAPKGFGNADPSRLHHSRSAEIKGTALDAPVIARASTSCKSFLAMRSG